MVFHLVNQHSFVAVGLVVLGIAFFAVRRLARVVRGVVLIALVVALTAFAVALRTGGGDIRRASDLDAAVGRGKPVALEFFSNY